MTKPTPPKTKPINTRASSTPAKPTSKPTKPQKGKRVRSRHMLIFVVLVVVTFLVMNFGQKAAVSYRIQREIDQLEQEVKAAETLHTKLLARRSYVASDLYVEKVARRDLKWAKSNETIVVVLTPNQPKLGENIHIPAVTENIKHTSPADSWAKLFFGEQ